MQLIKQKLPLMFITLLISLTSFSCGTTVLLAGGNASAPVRPKLVWLDEGERVSLSKEQAVALAHYFINIDAYIKKTQ